MSSSRKILIATAAGKQAQAAGTRQNCECVSSVAVYGIFSARKRRVRAVWA